MFTGIIHSQGVMLKKESVRGKTRLIFEVLAKSWRFELGKSIAVNGVCLTVADFRGKKFDADLIKETLKSTTLGGLRAGERVNLEPALRMGDEIGGHWVTGHVDGVGVIRKIEKRSGGQGIRIQAPRDLIHRFIPKGSVAIDGISFTLQEIHSDSFTVGVTPHTFKVTTLPSKREGSKVNLEVDLFAKLAEHFLAKKKTPSLNVKALQAQGF